MSSCSLHRWVLLKNSIRSTLSSPTSSTLVSPVSDISFEEETVDVGLDESEETDSFLFPQKLPDASEAEWLDSLLESLGDEEDLPLEDEEYSPVVSPMSSSDDLTQYSYPYPVPYPPLVRSDHEALPFDEDESVPDAIEDTSDDESETPSLPALTHSDSLDSSTSSDGPPSPHVYSSDSYFFPFVLQDPLPFSDEIHSRSYNHYSEC